MLFLFFGAFYFSFFKVHHFKFNFDHKTLYNHYSFSSLSNKSVDTALTVV